MEDNFVILHHKEVLVMGEELKFFSCFKEGRPCERFWAADIFTADEIAEHESVMLVEGDISKVKMRSAENLAMEMSKAEDLKAGDEYEIVIAGFIIKGMIYLDAINFGETIKMDKDIFLKFVPTEAPEAAIVYTYSYFTCIVSINGKEV